MGRRAENKDRTRQEILDTGLRLFRAEGFDETRVQDICDLVGISEKTFFNYFPSKRALLDASAKETLALYHALLEHELALPERTVIDRLLEIVDLWAQSFADDREFLVTVTTRTAMFFGASSGAMRDLHRSTQRLLADLLRQGQETGELNPRHNPLQLAEMLTAIMLLTTINWLENQWDEAEEPLTERLRRAASILIQGAACNERTSSRGSKGKTRRPSRSQR